MPSQMLVLPHEGNDSLKMCQVQGLIGERAAACQFWVARGSALPVLHALCHDQQIRLIRASHERSEWLVGISFLPQEALVEVTLAHMLSVCVCVCARALLSLFLFSLCFLNPFVFFSLSSFLLNLEARPKSSVHMTFSDEPCDLRKL